MKTRTLFIFSLLLTVLLLCLCATAIVEEAEENVLYIGDFSYVYKDDGTIKIVQVLEGHQTDDEEYLVTFEEGVMNYIPASIQGQPVTEIGDYALYSLKIQAWTIPGTVKKIGSGAFGHSEVETVIMEEGVEELGDFVFENMCVTNITIPSTVRKMGTNPFCNCFCYDRINLSPDNEYFSFVDGVLFENKGHTLVYYPFERNGTIYQVPEDTRKIGAYAFSGCNKLDTIIIPDSVTEIGEYAFTRCRFKSLELPRYLVHLRDGTFSYCGKPESILIPASVRWFGTYVFKNCEPECLIVEEGSMAEEYAHEHRMNYTLLEKQEETDNEHTSATKNESDAINSGTDSWEDALHGQYRGIKLGDKYKEEMSSNQQQFEISELVDNVYEWMQIEKATIEIDEDGRIWEIHCGDFDFDGIRRGSDVSELVERFGEPTDGEDDNVWYYGYIITDDEGMAIIEVILDPSGKLVNVILSLGL